MIAKPFSLPALAFALFPLDAMACSAPVDPVILIVCGDFNQNGALQETGLTLADLEKIGTTTITTSTVWTDGPQTFTGVWLRDLIDNLVTGGGKLTIIALNDYSVSLPLDEVVAGGMMLAYARNGENMSVRDMGPLWMVYPYDSSDMYRNEVAYSRSVWQLDQLIIETTALETTAHAAQPGDTTPGSANGGKQTPDPRDKEKQSQSIQ